MLLTEKFAELIESSKYTSIRNADKGAMALMLENTEAEIARLMAESSMSGDVAQFTPILMPLVRRVYPNLIANELLGVQPMTMPTGFIYALINRYTGDGAANKLAATAQGQVLKLSDMTGMNVGTVITGDVTGYTATIVYKEDNFVLVKLTVAGQYLTVEGINGTITITAVYTNEASFKKLLKGYSGSYTTAAGEVLGTDMREVGFSIDKKSVEAKVRKLKGQYTMEMYQDLKAQHGLLADEELMSLLSYEIQAEIDRECVDFVNSNATVLGNTSAFTSASDGSGRWAIEKFRTEVIRLATESKQIGLDTKRGSGNIILCSPKFATMLEQVGSFKTATQDSSVVSPVSGGVAGIFDNKFKVVIDQYATSDYSTVIYKGEDRRDGMGFFAPYVPLTFQKTMNPDSGQPAIIASTRYALATTPVNPEAYARTYGVNFANTILA